MAVVFLSLMQLPVEAMISFFQRLVTSPLYACTISPLPTTDGHLGLGKRRAGFPVAGCRVVWIQAQGGTAGSGGISIFSLLRKLISIVLL